MSEAREFKKITVSPMPTTIGRQYHFEAAHHLDVPGMPLGHKCRNNHGHSYEVWVEIHGIPDESGMVEGIEYDKLDLVVKPLVEFCDHKDLSDLFEVSTVEVLAAWFATRISELLDVHVTVTVYEGWNRKSWAGVSI